MTQKNTLLNSFKNDLINTPILYNLIDRPNTIGIFAVGSRTFDYGYDNKSDIDLICLTTGNYERQQSPYLLEYNSIHIHWDYHNLQNILNFNLPLASNRLQWFWIGAINSLFGTSYIIKLDPEYQPLISIFKQYKKDLALIGTYVLFNSIWPLHQSLIKNMINNRQVKVASALLLSYSWLFHEEIDWNIYLQWKHADSYKIREELQDYMYERMIKLRHFILEYPFNIARKELEISNALTQAYMEVRGINENYPSI